MLGPRSDSLDELPLEALERLDQLCEQFEARWTAGTTPALEEFLAAVSTAERGPLLRELLPLDVDYRCRRGESPCCEEYIRRLPNDADLIGRLWAELIV